MSEQGVGQWKKMLQMQRLLSMADFGPVLVQSWNNHSIVIMLNHRMVQRTSVKALPYFGVYNVSLAQEVGALPWTSYQIRKIAGCACAGNAGNVFPRRRFQRKPLVSDPGMHHGTCVTHVPWCMSGSLTCGDGENVPGIPGACAPAILRIWQEAHGMSSYRGCR